MEENYNQAIKDKTQSMEKERVLLETVERFKGQKSRENRSYC